MTITYEVGDALYINITNRCTNHCSFCVRNNSDGAGVVSGMNLWLKHEPSIDEVIEDIQKRDVSKYKEFVFCGYGEPMIRTYDIIEICKKLKGKYNIPIRINTNGQANLIHEEDITPHLEGWVDSISISLNAKDKQQYQAICQSLYGEKVFAAILDFAARSKWYIPGVAFSVVDLISQEDIQACRKIAQRIGADFHIRHFVD